MKKKLGDLKGPKKFVNEKDSMIYDKDQRSFYSYYSVCLGLKVPETFITYFNLVYWYWYIILEKDTVIFKGQRSSVPISYCIT